MSIGQHDNPHDTILPVTGRVLRALVTWSPVRRASLL
jgi:hypothetical protein